MLLVWKSAARCTFVCSRPLIQDVSEATCCDFNMQEELCCYVHLRICFRGCASALERPPAKSQHRQLFRKRCKEEWSRSNRSQLITDRLISALLKGEAGMRDESPLWISQWHTAVCHHKNSHEEEKPQGVKCKASHQWYVGVVILSSKSKGAKWRSISLILFQSCAQNTPTPPVSHNFTRRFISASSN